jgi:hypothetical protein
MDNGNTTSRRIQETVIEGRRLGRHVLHDPRSRDFSASRAPKIVSVTHAATGLPLDQGNIGSCTANALCGALDSSPDNAGGKAYTENQAVSLYELETKLEGQPYPPNDPGGSGLMVCKAAKQLGWISSYAHAFGIQHALEALVLRPVITGGGGHEVVADGIDADNQLVWFWNSWGTQFALGGRFCMSFDTWEQLLSSQGDVTVPIV